jgi:hypothetical protein
MTLADKLSSTLTTLFSELIHGAPRKGSYVLNGGDDGLLGALDAITAETASNSVSGGATIAAHVAHLQYGLGLMNQWASKGGNPFAGADWAQAWRVGKVTEQEWADLRHGLATEAKLWREVLSQPREVSSMELRGMIGSIVHLAYHLGALRQIEPRLRGPREP